MDTEIRIKLAEPAPVLVDASGAETATLPGVRLGAVTHFALYIFDAAGAALDLSGCAEFKLTLAKTYGGAGVMFRALAGFTRSASAADPVRADLYVDTELLRRYLGSQAQGRAILALNGYKPGSTLAELAVEVPVWLLARSDYDALPEDLETGAYNQAQVNVMINDLHAETAALDQRITDFEALREDAREFSETAKTSEDNAKASEDAAKTSEDNARASENAAKTSEDNAKASEDAAKTSETNAKNSETAAQNSENAAGISAAEAAAASANAQNYELLRDDMTISGLEEDASHNIYKRLTAAGDTVRFGYNLTDCLTLSLHLKSYNPAIAGSITLAVKVAGMTVQTPVVPVGAAYAWIDLVFDSAQSGGLVIELVTGLTDGGAPVAVLLDNVRTTSRFTPLAVGRVDRKVALKPCDYSDADGYRCFLDGARAIAFGYPVDGCRAVALRVASGNAAIAGNAVLTVTVGTTAKTVTVPIGATAAWVLLALDAAASGAVTVARDTAAAGDTLKDGAAVVAAVVTDINTYYLEA
ncbi:MAG: hypothetical protein VB042_08790 [Victivallaceae bacterium]|nr:hypothetical protein [Victivallaceae bacterium]